MVTFSSNVAPVFLLAQTRFVGKRAICSRTCKNFCYKAMRKRDRSLTYAINGPKTWMPVQLKREVSTVTKMERDAFVTVLTTSYQHLPQKCQSILCACRKINCSDPLPCNSASYNLLAKFLRPPVHAASSHAFLASLTICRELYF